MEGAEGGGGEGRGLCVIALLIHVVIMHELGNTVHMWY